MNYKSPYTLSVKIERDEATADDYYNLEFCTQMVSSCAESLNMFTQKDMRILDNLLMALAERASEMAMSMEGE